MVFVIFPDPPIDCVHHIEPADRFQPVAQIILHEIDQFIGVSFCGDSIVPRLLCTRSGCFSSSLLLLRFPALSLGFCFLGESFSSLTVCLCFLRESFPSLTVCFGSGCKGGIPCCVRASVFKPTKKRRRDRQDEQNTNNDELLACCSLLCLRLGLLLLGLRQSFTANPAVPTGPDHRSQHIMRNLYAADMVAIFVGKEPGVYQLIENRLRYSRARERVIQGATVAKTARRQQPIFNKSSHARIERLKRTEIEVFEYFLLLQIEKFRRDLRARTLLEPPLIELLQH